MSALASPILVTGGTGALGRAVVAELLEAGALVVATWVVPRERDSVAEALGNPDGLELVEADLSSEEGAAAAVAAVPEGGPAALVNLVGGFAAGGRVHEAPERDLERMLALNVTIAYRMAQASLPAMLERGAGSIVLVGAKTALEPFSGGAAYSVSKAAVLALVRALALEYRGDGVRANAILPSVIDTPANRDSEPDADHSKWVSPAEIARVIAFLCSDASAPTSGAFIPVYGRAG